MGMFDYYEPDPGLDCPRCGRNLNGWQGKDAEKALFFWKQGVPHPTGQEVSEESRLSDEELARFNLPEEFLIYTHCTCSTKFFIEATGGTRDGVWAETKLLTPDDIDEAYPHLSRGERKARRLWLADGWNDPGPFRKRLQCTANWWK